MKMRILEDELGESMTAEDLAEYLKLNPKTVRKHYRKLGGIRLGHHYRFFERKIINAIQKGAKMGGSSAIEWEEEGKNISDEKGGYSLGNQGQEKSRRDVARRDKYGLLN